MKKTYKASLEKIPELAKEIATQIKGGEIFALIGTLGAGKTTFSRALAKQLGVTSQVTSPTFVLMNRHQARTKIGNKKIFLYHLDLYRTETFAESEALGIAEFWGQPDTVALIEWADKIKNHLPKKTIYIHFS